MNPLANRLPMRSSRARGAALLVGTVCLLAAGYLFIVPTLRDRGGPDIFPPISIATIDGRSFDAAAVQGRPLLVTFWSTTCLVCLKEMPDLDALYRRLSPRGFEIIAVSMPWDPPDEVVRLALSLIHISEPTRRTPISYAVFCLKKKKII